jgi:hypothetical protein
MVLHHRKPPGRVLVPRHMLGVKVSFRTEVLDHLPLSLTQKREIVLPLDSGFQAPRSFALAAE